MFIPEYFLVGMPFAYLDASYTIGDTEHEEAKDYHDWWISCGGKCCVMGSRGAEYLGTASTGN
jgi:hypothetical protein